MRSTSYGLPLLLAVAAFGGCGKPAPNAAALALPKTDGPAAWPPKPREAPVGDMTVERLLGEVPEVDLVQLELKIDGVDFTIRVPQGTTASSLGTLYVYLPDGSGLEMFLEHRLAFYRRWWTKGALYEAKNFLVASADTLFTESTEPGEARFHFDAVVTTGNLDVSIRNTRKGDVGAVIDTRPACVQLLKCARTLAIKGPVPADPIAAVEKLGGSVSRDESGKVIAVRLRTCTRSTLALLDAFPDLKGLAFFCANIKGVEFGPILRKLPSLESLDFRDTFLNDDQLEAVGELKELKSLRLSKCQISATGVAHLKPLTGLTKLDIEHNDLDDLGVDAFAGMTDLESLSLHASYVGDTVLKALGGMLKLKTLDLRTGIKPDTPAITDAGLVHLYGLKKLEMIDLRYTKVTAEGVAALKAALPGAKVKFGK